MDIKIYLDDSTDEQYQCIFHDNDGWCKLNHYTNGDEFCDVLLRYNKCSLKEHKEIIIRI